MLVVIAIILLSLVNIIVVYQAETCGKDGMRKKLTITAFIITGMIWVGLMIIIPRSLSGDHITQNGQYVTTYENAFTLGKSLGNDIFIYICCGILLVIPAFIPVVIGGSNDLKSFMNNRNKGK